MQANFLLGNIIITDKAAALLNRTPLDLIARHAVNDHGRVTPREQKANAEAMKSAGAIISRYSSDPTKPDAPEIEVFTADEWGETTVRLRGE